MQFEVNLCSFGRNGEVFRDYSAPVLTVAATSSEVDPPKRTPIQSMLGMELTLRSHTVQGVYQELWGALIAYNLIRREIAKAALDAGHAPNDLRFIRAFHIIQYEMTWAAVTRSYGKLPMLLTRLRERLKQLPNEKRPGCSCARAVKSRPFRYTVRFLKKDLN